MKQLTKSSKNSTVIGFRFTNRFLSSLPSHFAFRTLTMSCWLCITLQMPNILLQKVLHNIYNYIFEVLPNFNWNFFFFLIFFKNNFHFFINSKSKFFIIHFIYFFLSIIIAIVTLITFYLNVTPVSSIVVILNFDVKFIFNNIRRVIWFARNSELYYVKL